MLAALDHSHLEHFVIGLAVQLCLWPLFGRWSAAAISVAVFVGREIAQHEMKGGGGNAVVWYYGLVHHWSLDSLLDVAAPVVGCFGLALLVTLGQRGLSRYRERGARG
ncbi:hypothetical protein [Halomonas sp. DN3]|uniref:hypothetical protein n=1 Tax=Halomonas sp. DN3 TaxID=2953657 RepID=UPI00209EF15A|nr:hypothetical protein [Halomonas sp. DN3]USZ49712.1 hypothetical protein NKF27_19880 [Halomonas sp. DN3]